MSDDRTFQHIEAETAESSQEKQWAPMWAVSRPGTSM